VRHKRIRFDHFLLNGVPVEVRYGDLLIAQDECAELMDWEVVVSTRDVLELAMSPYDVHMETHDARQLWGPGLLVRSDGKSHVFRGGGTLDGFSAEELQG
jgi:hypothetical protein